MHPMKKKFFVAGGIAMAFVPASTVFALTFDMNSYRTRICTFDYWARAYFAKKAVSLSGIF